MRRAIISRASASAAAKHVKELGVRLQPPSHFNWGFLCCCVKSDWKEKTEVFFFASSLLHWSISLFVSFWLFCFFACMHSSQCLTRLNLNNFYIMIFFCFHSFFTFLTIVLQCFAWLIDYRHCHLALCITHLELKKDAGRLPVSFEFHTFEKKHIFNSSKSCGLSMLLMCVKTTNDRRDEVVLFRQVIAGLFTLNTVKVVYFRPSGSSCGYQRCHVW